MSQKDNIDNNPWFQFYLKQAETRHYYPQEDLPNLDESA